MKEVTVTNDLQIITVSDLYANSVLPKIGNLHQK